MLRARAHQEFRRPTPCEWLAWNPLPSNSHALFPPHHTPSFCTPLFPPCLYARNSVVVVLPLPLPQAPVRRTIELQPRCYVQRVASREGGGNDDDQAPR